ncbi:helicase RepA family protein [Bradyrhizobium sp. WYCCWR 13023]|uniref:Helicase RepA family protein n=1 Tax=Bradyrhizobium zhengyangense TaxID=2911009 RepID=A0A9X1R727_9BRAD|nr:AAA family ATPase [Bradyrhizobium zhengyangense]MCG2626576.1 helicase RepA family protein [Bradyrhizobium zhengyangense]
MRTPDVPQARPKGFGFELFGNIGCPTEAAKSHIIKGIFAYDETSAWVGPPGSLKSALLADAAVAIASGADWFGHRNKCQTGVIYFALERADLVRRRLLAIAKSKGLERLPIAVVPAVVDLVRPDSVRKVLDTIADVEAEFYGPDFDGGTGMRGAGVLMFDTWAKLIAAGGGDENQAKDQGAIFANLQRIKNVTGGPHVALIGHTGKEADRGPRGSSAIVGDVDMLVTINGEEIKTASITKANDAPEGPLFSFKSKVHEFGFDEDGDPITVNIIEATDEVQASQGRQPKLTPNQRTMLLLLQEAGKAGLITEDWNAKAKEAGIGERRRADLTDARAGLKAKGLAREYMDRWNACS